jgi:hypothetical protein
MLQGQIGNADHGVEGLGLGILSIGFRSHGSFSYIALWLQLFT